MCTYISAAKANPSLEFLRTRDHSKRQLDFSLLLPWTPYYMRLAPLLRHSQDERLGATPAPRSFPKGSAQSRLALTRQVGGTVVDLLVQLCGGDGGAVVVGMMSQAFPAGMIRGSCRQGTSASIHCSPCLYFVVSAL